MTVTFDPRIVWLAPALSLWLLGCTTNSNPAKSTPATETSVAKVTSSNSVLDKAKAQRTLTLWIAQYARRAFTGPPHSGSAIITGPLTPFRGDQNHIVVRFNLHVDGYAQDYPDAIAHFIRGQDGNWYLTSAGSRGAGEQDLNLKVE